MTVAHSITSSARASSVGGHIEAERLGGAQIDQKLELCWALRRHQTRLGALHYLVDVESRAATHRHVVRSVGHQGAGLECLSRVGAERQTPCKREPCDESSRLKRQAFLVDRDGLQSGARHRVECRLQSVGRAGFEYLNDETELLGCGSGHVDVKARRLRIWIDELCKAGQSRNGLFEKLQAPSDDVR